MRPSLHLIFALLFGFGPAAALSQDAPPASETPETEVTPAEAEEVAESDESEAPDDDPLIDLDDPDFADLDRQTYEEDEDDFVPTEEVPADEAIPFPTDI